MSSLIQFPTCPFVDKDGKVSRPWMLWLQNPQFVSLNILGVLGINSGGTGTVIIPSSGQLLIGNGSGYSLGTLTAGTGLTITNGAGTISASITPTSVTPSSYGNATNVAKFTVNSLGQITSASNIPIAIVNTQVSGLGTMSVQNANAVNITGGTSDAVAITTGTIDNTPIGVTTQNTLKATSVQATGGLGCNSKTPQTAYASGGSVAVTSATNITPYGFTTAAQANAIITLLNNIQAALVANGIMT